MLLLINKIGWVLGENSEILKHISQILESLLLNHHRNIVIVLLSQKLGNTDWWGTIALFMPL